MSFLFKSVNHTIATATVISVLVAIVYAVISLLQYGIAKGSLIESQRAFIAISPGAPESFVDNNERKWRVLFNISNGGDTPTRNLTIRFGEVIQHDINLSGKVVTINHITPENGLTALAYFRKQPSSPFFESGKQQYNLPSGALSDDQAFGLSRQRGDVVFLWGLAEYNDVFKGTPRHLTEFCLFMTPTSGSVPSYSQCDQNNCADDECLAQDAAQAREWHRFPEQK